MRRKPQQQRSIELVSSVIEAATRILRKGGRFTTNKVAEVAGISIGSFYQYFTKKEDLVDALVTKYTQERTELFCQLVNAAKSQPNLETALTKFIDDALKCFFTERSLLSSLFITFLNPATIRKIQEEEDQVQKALKELLVHHGISQQKADVSAYTLLHSSLGLIRASFANQRIVDKECIAQELKRLLLPYIKAKGGQ